jgi:hypothetical protein
MTSHQTYFCGACGRLIPGPTGAPCRHCLGTPPARHRPERVDLLVALLVGVAVGAFLLWPSMCRADGSSPTGAAKASASIATAARLSAECMSPKECAVADQMLVAARAELAAALVLADTAPRPRHARGPSDPWEPRDACANPFETDYEEPFASVDTVPAAVEAQAAFELAAVQDDLDGIVRP